METISAYPLTWPLGYERTRFRRNGPFKVSFASARDGLLSELERMGARHVVISANIPLRQDGLPYANWRQPDDAGIAVYFTLFEQQNVLCCDYYNKVDQNMQALHKTVEALRGIDRWHCSEILKRSFTGFKALPENSETNAGAWWQVLEVERTATREQITAAYKRLAKQYHPDVNPDNPEYFHVIQNAYQQALLTNGQK